MVKNTTGGNKQKGQARKSGSSSNKNIRLSTSDEERYAMVSRLYGGKICEVHTDNNLKLKCVIRGKFSGKFKRNNAISAGTIVLVGLRSWEKETTVCDLMEVYDASEVQYIQNLPNINFAFYANASKAPGDEIFANPNAGDDFIMEEDEDMPKASSVKTVTVFDEDDIDYDNI